MEWMHVKPYDSLCQVLLQLRPLAAMASAAAQGCAETHVGGHALLSDQRGPAPGTAIRAYAQRVCPGMTPFTR